MKISMYNWSWWFVMNIIILIVLSDFAMFDVKFTPTQETIYNVSWFMWLVSTIICLYVGLKPMTQEK